MTQLSLIMGGSDVEPVRGITFRRLPLLRSVPIPAAPAAKSVLVNGRLRSVVTMPGYRKGLKPGNAGRTFPAELLTHTEIMRLLDACGAGFTGVRNRAEFTVMWRCGLRIAELLALVPKDVDLERGELIVLHGKNDKRRIVGFDDRTGRMVEDWLSMRGRLPVTRLDPIFCTIMRPTVGRPQYQSCVREALKDTARRAGIEKRVNPHSLRHRFACDLAREGVQIPIISKLLGHSNSAVTARYIDHVDPFEAIEVARARSWADLRSVA